MELKWQLEEREQKESQKTFMQQKIMASDWERFMEVQNERDRLESENSALKDEILGKSRELQRKSTDICTLEEQVQGLELQTLRFIDEPDNFLRKSALKDLEKLSERLQQVNIHAHRVQKEIIRRLHADKEDLHKQIETNKDEKLCCICQDSEKAVLFLPCKHICVCGKCRERLSPYRCPICKQEISSFLHKVHF